MVKREGPGDSVRRRIRRWRKEKDQEMVKREGPGDGEKRRPWR